MRLRQAALLVGAVALIATVGWSAQQRGFAEPVVTIGDAGSLTTVTAPPAVPAPSPQDSPVGSNRPQIDSSWAEQTASKAGLPVAALVAYARATLLVGDDCKIGWTTLAGVGWVESHHGTIEDRTLSADGRSEPPIIGPALNGAGPVAAISAPRGSQVWHGDSRWDHAVGPMQFISDTWLRWESDGDGDGLKDPHDLDDAAYAAARYLCAGGYDLSSGDGWSRAIFSYNHAQFYVDAVRSAASFYATRVT